MIFGKPIFSIYKTFLMDCKLTVPESILVCIWRREQKPPSGSWAYSRDQPYISDLKETKTIVRKEVLCCCGSGFKTRLRRKKWQNRMNLPTIFMTKGRMGVRKGVPAQPKKRTSGSRTPTLQRRLVPGM